MLALVVFPSRYRISDGVRHVVFSDPETTYLLAGEMEAQWGLLFYFTFFLPLR